MRIALFRKTSDQMDRVAVDCGDGFFEVKGLALSQAIEMAHQGQPFELSGGVNPQSVQLRAPVLPTSRILCVATNYATFIETYGGSPPEFPMIFSKVDSTMIGPNDPIVLPTESDCIDWEAELAVVVGQSLRRGTLAEAEAAILGFTVSNDVSVRDWQSRTAQWFQGKNFERTCPIGPWITTKDDSHWQGHAQVTTTIDGVVYQDGDTSDMLFSPAALLSYLSTFMTLRAGDVVLTGTPPGVGSRLTPPVFLQVGQTLRTTIGSLGELCNRIVSE